MKKLVAVALAAGLLSVLGAQAASAQLLDVSAGDLTAGVFPEDEFALLSSSGHPFAVGGGKTATTQFAFSAHLGPKGPSGYAVVKTASEEAQGHVVCYQRLSSGGEGGVARFGVEIDPEKASGLPEPVGGSPFLLFHVFDSGQPGGTGDSVVVEQSPVPCTSFFLFAGGLVTQGNIVVKN